MKAATLLGAIFLLISGSELPAQNLQLSYSTYLGGSSIDCGHGIALGTDGEAYVAGYTISTDFPTLNLYQAGNSGGIDVFVSRLSSSGSSLIYSTYLGGGDDDYGYGIILGTGGEAYVTGYTQSYDFPTLNPHQASNNGVPDVFVSRFSSSGSSLIYSTYLGGGSADYGHGITVGTGGEAYITGHTRSSDFPTLNPYQASNNGDYDAFVSRLSSSGSSLICSTYLGGSSPDYGFGITVGTDSEAYVAGYTISSDFPTLNPYQAINNGDYDAFVSRLSSSGSALIYSTFLGGGSADWGEGIILRTGGEAYVAGLTLSLDFPTLNPYQASNSGVEDVFVSRLSSSGSSLICSTYLGGSSPDYGFGITVGTGGEAYVTGSTLSLGFPTLNPHQASNSGGSDAFVSRLSSSGSELIYSTYLGGSDDDDVYGITVGTGGEAYVAGTTLSSDFPTLNSYQASYNGDYDAFVSKLVYVPSPSPSATPEGYKTPHPSATPSPTPSATPEVSPSVTPSPTPSPPPSPTASPTPEGYKTPTPTPTTTSTPTPSVTPTSTPIGFTLLYHETFDSYPIGADLGSGTPPYWTVDTTNAGLLDDRDWFHVQNVWNNDTSMVAKDTNGEAIWITQTIGISGYKDLILSANFAAKGLLESNDHSNSFYELDGTEVLWYQLTGPPPILDQWVNFTTSISPGVNLIVRWHACNLADDEHYGLDDVVVSGFPITPTPTPTPAPTTTPTPTPLTPTPTPATPTPTPEGAPGSFEIVDISLGGQPIKSNNPWLAWFESHDPDGGPITYTLQIATDNLFNDIVYVKSGIQDLSYWVQDTSFGDAVYYWKVTAVDNEGQSTQCDNPGSFNIAESGAEFRHLVIPICDDNQILFNGDNTQVDVDYDDKEVTLVKNWGDNNCSIYGWFLDGYQETQLEIKVNVSQWPYGNWKYSAALSGHPNPNFPTIRRNSQDPPFDYFWFVRVTPTSIPTPTPTPTPMPRPEIMILESGDYSGDGLSDIAFFRPGSGLWSVRGLSRLYFGKSGDFPVSGDYDGDGCTDIAVFRPVTGLWAVMDFTRIYCGKPNVKPVPGDYDGDGCCDIAFVKENPSLLWTVRSITRMYYGTKGDLCIPADYDGNGSTTAAIFRPSTQLWAVRDYTKFYFGKSGDTPLLVYLQWHGIMLWAEAAVFRPSSGLWAVRDYTRFYFGHAGDVPLPANYTGNFFDEMVIFRQDNGLWSVRGVTAIYFGKPGDIPVTR